MSSPDDHVPASTPEQVKDLMSLDLYQYTPLNPDKREIRLITVENDEELLRSSAHLDNIDLPQEPHDRETFLFTWMCRWAVRCTIETVSLDDCPEYIALSYTWGDPTGKIPILLNGARFMVTKNLNQAFRHAVPRQKTESGHLRSCKLWVDAICINQEDNHEKAWQVQMMYLIYQKASLTSVWLGPAADDSDLLMEQIQKLSRIMVVEHPRGELTPDTQLQFAQSWLNKLAPLDRALSVSALSAFIHRPYWSRVWIQQELQASQDCCFNCGFMNISRLDLHALIMFIMAVQQLPEQARGITAGSEQFFEQMFMLDEKAFDLINYATLRYEDRSSEGRPTITLQKALEDSYVTGYGLCASEKRDLIYALLNLVEDAEDLGIYPNYKIEYKQLVSDVARGIINKSGLDILRYCNSLGEDGVPSWAPDWSKPILRPLELFKVKDKKLYSYQASGDTIANFTFENVPGGSAILSLDGIVVDSVLWTGDTLQDPDPHTQAFHAENIDTYLSWIRTLWAVTKSATIPLPYLFMENGPFGNGEAIWRTPIADIEPIDGVGWTRATGAFQAIFETLFDEENTSPLDQRLWMKYLSILRVASHGRKYFLTHGLRLGLGPPHMEEGDSVALIFGLNVPFVLREVGDSKYRIIGEAYVDGMMDGQMAPYPGNPFVRKLWIC
ncbi:hypothetical protein ACHAPT_005112 [Fusarium lateritium]